MTLDTKRLSRRHFLGRGSALAGAGALGWGIGGNALSALAAELADPTTGTASSLRAAEVLASYLVDTQGNGSVKAGDEKIIRAVLRARRGSDVRVREGYDYRADLFGRGRVDNLDLKAVKAAIAHYRQHPDEILPRPVTVAWHYSWYNNAGRPINGQHVWFVDGGYSSQSPETEATFNDLKNEFGITVDAISWADPTADGNLNRNTELGYLPAANVKTRRAALLYESLISLRAEPGERIDFEIAKTRNRLINHFRGMARTLNKLDRQSKAKLFTIDDKPVIFIYASHTWGTNIDGTGPQYDGIDQAMANARIAFGKIFGAEPFVIGEETTFGVTDVFDAGRRRRSANFDGVFVYHHASSAQFIIDGGRNLRGAYVDQVKQVLRRTYEGAMEHRSRFTGKPMLVIPSLAAGFSKVNVPTLFSNRADYAGFLAEMIQFHRDEYLVPAFGENAHRIYAPVVTVGSWNEEWEGHAVFPSKFNRTLSPRTQKGFDYVMAIKQAVGWNHYAKRGLPPVAP